MKKQYSKLEAFKNAVQKRNERLGVNRIQLLQSQSVKDYQLKKDTVTSLYWIERVKDRKKTVSMNRDQAEDFILYGLKTKECNSLEFN